MLRSCGEIFRNTKYRCGAWSFCRHPRNITDLHLSPCSAGEESLHFKGYNILLVTSFKVLLMILWIIRMSIETTKEAKADLLSSALALNITNFVCCYNLVHNLNCSILFHSILFYFVLFYSQWSLCCVCALRVFLLDELCRGRMKDAFCPDTQLVIVQLNWVHTFNSLPAVESLLRCAWVCVWIYEWMMQSSGPKLHLRNYSKVNETEWEEKVAELLTSCFTTEGHLRIKKMH